MKADDSFEVLGHRFRSKRDFARKLGYKAQLIDSDIIKRYGSFELFVRRKFSDLSDAELHHRLSILSDISINQKKFDKTCLNVLEHIYELIDPTVKDSILTVSAKQNRTDKETIIEALSQYLKG